MKKLLSILLSACLITGAAAATPVKAKEANIKPKLVETADKRIATIKGGNITYEAIYDKKTNTMELINTDDKGNKTRETLDFNSTEAPAVISPSNASSISGPQESISGPQYEYTVIASRSLPTCGLYYKAAYLGGDQYKWYLQSMTSSYKTKYYIGTPPSSVFTFKEAVDEAYFSIHQAIIKAGIGVLSVVQAYIKYKTNEELRNVSDYQIAVIFLSANLALSAVGDASNHIRYVGKADFYYWFI